MDSKKELFWLVDENDEVLGSVSRGEAHSDPSKIHRAVTIIAQNNNNETLFQQRSQHKDLEPGYWTLSCGGNVTYGQTYEEAAQRELEEELGYIAEVTYLSKILYRGKEQTEFIALFNAMVGDAEPKMDPTEVQAVEWVPNDQIKEFVSSHQMSQIDIKILKHLGTI